MLGTSPEERKRRDLYAAQASDPMGDDILAEMESGATARSIVERSRLNVKHRCIISQEVTAPSTLTGAKECMLVVEYERGTARISRTSDLDGE